MENKHHYTKLEDLPENKPYYTKLKDSGFYNSLQKGIYTGVFASWLFLVAAPVIGYYQGNIHSNKWNRVLSLAAGQDGKLSKQEGEELAHLVGLDEFPENTSQMKKLMSSRHVDNKTLDNAIEVYKQK